MEVLRRMRGMRRSRKAALALFLVYLAVAAGCTVYAQTGYISNLPAVSLTKPVSAEIPFTLEELAVAEDGKIHYEHPSGKGLPNDVIVPGQTVELTGSNGQSGIGEVLSIAGGSLGLGGADLWITVKKGNFSDGEAVKIRIVGNTLTYQNAIPRAALWENLEGKSVLYTVKTAEGPWGVRFVLKQTVLSSVWPYNSESEYVRLSLSVRESGEPIVLSCDADDLYDGMEVQLRTS